MKLVVSRNSQGDSFVYYQSWEFTALFSSHAPADLFSLLSWCCGLYVIVIRYSSGSASRPLWTSLASSMAILLDLLLPPLPHATPSVRKGAVLCARRALRSVNKKIVFLGLCIHHPLVPCSSS